MEEPVKGAMAGPPAPTFRAASGDPASQSYYRRVGCVALHPPPHPDLPCLRADSLCL